MRYYYRFIFVIIAVLAFQAIYSAEDSPRNSRISEQFGASITKQQVEHVLALHNKARADVGVPPLRWSNELASFAQAWADHLAAKDCKVHHRPNSGTWKQRYGENIFMGTRGYYDVGDAVQSWESEKKHYKGTVTASNYMKVGHYTQMVWKTTTHVGCGIAECDDYIIVVCNYNPPGNILGQKPY